MTNSGDVAATGKANWSRLAAFGFAMAAAGPILLILAGLVFGLSMGDIIVFFGVTTLVSLVGALLVLRFGTWAKIVGIVLSLAVAFLLSWTLLGLLSPTSFFDYTSALLIVPGAVIALIGCIAALVAGSRGHRSPGMAPGERKAIRVVMTAVVVLAAISAALNVATRSSADPSDAALRIRQKDFKFNQRTYEVAGGSKVFVRNSDPFLHTFTIKGLGIDVQLIPGSKKLIPIAAKPGTYILYCRPHIDDPEKPTKDDMAAEFTVT